MPTLNKMGWVMRFKFSMLLAFALFSLEGCSSLFTNGRNSLEIGGQVRDQNYAASSPDVGPGRRLASSKCTKSKLWDEVCIDDEVLVVPEAWGPFVLAKVVAIFSDGTLELNQLDADCIPRPNSQTCKSDPVQSRKHFIYDKKTGSFPSEWNDLRSHRTILNVSRPASVSRECVVEADQKICVGDEVPSLRFLSLNYEIAYILVDDKFLGMAIDLPLGGLEQDTRIKTQKPYVFVVKPKSENKYFEFEAHSYEKITEHKYECGLSESTIESRISDCAKLQGSSRTSSTGIQWSLVARRAPDELPGVHNEVWQDAQTGLLWTRVLAYDPIVRVNEAVELDNITQQVIKEKICNRLRDAMAAQAGITQRKFGLPSAAELDVAARDGALEIIPTMRRANLLSLTAGTTLSEGKLMTNNYKLAGGSIICVGR